jgi:DNA repair exonuclease SbcCD ATPase subunit
MSGGRIEGSVLTSLSELRAIERQRLADEIAAVEAAVQAKRRERELAERTAREAEAARVAAEREARVAAEIARADAERQAQLQRDAIEAAERARHLIALEERRFGEEMALQREIARRQRPRWMIAVTGLAVIAAIGLGWFSVEQGRVAAAARAARENAIAAQTQAQRDARDARATAEVLAHSFDDLQHKVATAIQQVSDSQREAAARDAADRELAFQRSQAELKKQQRQLEQAREDAKRKGGVQISDECLHNAVCRENRGQ